jgi:hypothetical protein
MTTDQADIIDKYGETITTVDSKYIEALDYDIKRVALGVESLLLEEKSTNMLGIIIPIVILVCLCGLIIFFIRKR